MAGRGQGLTSLQSVGALLGFPALASALSPADPAANIPGVDALPVREVGFHRTLPRVARKAPSVMFPWGPSMRPRSLLEIRRTFSPRTVPRKRVSYPQLGEVTFHRRHQG